MPGHQRGKSGIVAFAYHSLGDFDRHQTIRISGTVQDFHWTNPHVWISLVAPDKAGAAREWEIEGGSPTVLRRGGWARR